jgi:tetratricopeptide (TPR) repeat protein
MQLPRRDDPKVNVCGLVFDWLNSESSGCWLLVIDNADDSSIFLPLTGSALSSGNVVRTRKPLLSYIPTKPSSEQSILITTRDSRLGWNLAHGEQPIYVLPFGAAQSKRLLASKAGKNLDSLDDSDAEELLELLDHIPLAIAQAATFMRQNSMSLHEYLTALKKDERNLSEYLSAQHLDPRRELGVPSSVFRTWKLMFNQIQVQHPRAAEMFYLSAMFDRQQIPQQLLLRGRENKNDLNFVQSIGILTGFSLITNEIGHQTFSMHRLVQLSILAWLEQNKQKAEYERKALLSLSNICPKDISLLQSTRDLERLYPHLQAVLQYRFERPSTVGTWARLLCFIIDFDRLQGRLDVAQDKSLQAYQKTKKVLGDDTLTTLACLLHVMQGLDIQGEFEKAEKMCQTLIRGYTKTVGEDHQCTLYAMISRVRRLQEQMDYGAAEEISTQLLENCKNILGIEHDLTQDTTAELSRALQSQGKVEAAEKLCRQMLDQLENKLGPDHHQTLTGVTELAILLRDRGDNQTAEEMFRRALQGRMNLQGEHPQHTLSTMLCLADVLQRRGDYSEAEKWLRRMLQMEKAVFEEKSTASPRANFALAYNLYFQGKYHSASLFCQRSLARWGEMNGSDNREIVECSHLYDSILRGMREEAARG